MSVEIFALEILHLSGQARADLSAGGRCRAPYRPRTLAIQKDQLVRTLGRIASSYHSEYAATGLDLNRVKALNHEVKSLQL